MCFGELHEEQNNKDKIVSYQSRLILNQREKGNLIVRRQQN